MKKVFLARYNQELHEEQKQFNQEEPQDDQQQLIEEAPKDEQQLMQEDHQDQQQKHQEFDQNLQILCHAHGSATNRRITRSLTKATRQMIQELEHFDQNLSHGSATTRRITRSLTKAGKSGGVGSSNQAENYRGIVDRFCKDPSPGRMKQRDDDDADDEGDFEPGHVPNWGTVKRRSIR